MAKETFDRSKPHVNIGTIGHVQKAFDSSGNLTVDSYADSAGNPDLSSVVEFAAPASLGDETAIVVMPIDNEFAFDPNSSGPAVSIDYRLELFVKTISGTPDVDVTFDIFQGEHFIASLAPGTPSIDNAASGWTPIEQLSLQAADFVAADGGPELPDFSRPFQFGFAFTGEYSSTALDVELGLDNMHVEITTIPEPTSMALALAIGAAALWQRCWGSND